MMIPEFLLSFQLCPPPLNTVSSAAGINPQNHLPRRLLRTGQVSGFIIFGCDLHNARGIKLNLHNSFDYTCY